MINNKGQIHVIFLILLVVGFILYINFSDKSLLKFIIPETKTSAPPVKQKENPPVPVNQVQPLPPSPSITIPDTIPPVRSNPQPLGSLPSETRKITLSLETNEKANCKYSNISGMYYDLMQGKFDQTGGISHSVLITTLSEGEKYKYHIRCSDEQGNKNIDDFAVSFEVKLPEDKTPSILTNPSHQGAVLPIDTKEVVISISTNEPASCRYSVNSGIPYNSMSGSFSYYDQTKKFHTKKITGLEDGKSYDFFVRCKDMAGNINTGDVLISFKVAVP